VWTLAKLLSFFNNLQIPPPTPPPAPTIQFSRAFGLTHCIDGGRHSLHLWIPYLAEARELPSKFGSSASRRPGDIMHNMEVEYVDSHTYWWETTWTTKVDCPSREWIRTKCAVVEFWLSIEFDLLQRLVLPKNLYEQSTQGTTLHSGNFANRTHHPVLFWTKYYWNIISMAPNAVLAHQLNNAFGISNVHKLKQLT
jgi:hypothetical protein